MPRRRLAWPELSQKYGGPPMPFAKSLYSTQVEVSGDCLTSIERN
jgi:hypothetical protein